AAAICPNAYGSSTIGVKKSAVVTTARSGATRYTAASSAVSNPTRRSSSAARGSSARSGCRSAGESLQAHPAPCDSAVSRGGGIAVLSAAVPERPFTDEELDAALEALTQPERFREAEARVARIAPQLQHVLYHALDVEGGF